MQPVMQWKSNKYVLRVCVCSLKTPAGDAHDPYCHVTCPALQYFSTIPHKRHDFREKKVTEHKTERDMIKMYLLQVFI